MYMQIEHCHCKSRCARWGTRLARWARWLPVSHLSFVLMLEFFRLLSPISTSTSLDTGVDPTLEPAVCRCPFSQPTIISQPLSFSFPLSHRQIRHTLSAGVACGPHLLFNEGREEGVAGKVSNNLVSFILNVIVWTLLASPSLSLPNPHADASPTLETAA